MHGKSIVAALAVAAGLCGLFAAPGLAQHTKLGNLTIERLWARPSIGQTGNSVAYMRITNAGALADVLVSVATPVAKAAELHETQMEGNVMRMRRAEGGVAIPPAGITEFEPGGLHVMLLGLTKPLKEGDSFPLTLTFEKAGPVTVEVTVAPIAGPGKQP